MYIACEHRRISGRLAVASARPDAIGVALLALLAVLAVTDVSRTASAFRFGEFTLRHRRVSRRVETAAGRSV